MPYAGVWIMPGWIQVSGGHHWMISMILTASLLRYIGPWCLPNKHKVEEWLEVCEDNVPISFATRRKFLNDIFPVSSSSNNRKAFRISSRESFSLYTHAQNEMLLLCVIFIWVLWKYFSIWTSLKQWQSRGQVVGLTRTDYLGILIQKLAKDATAKKRMSRKNKQTIEKTLHVGSVRSKLNAITRLSCLYNPRLGWRIYFSPTRGLYTRSILHPPKVTSFDGTVADWTSYTSDSLHTRHLNANAQYEHQLMSISPSYKYQTYISPLQPLKSLKMTITFFGGGRATAEISRKSNPEPKTNVGGARLPDLPTLHSPFSYRSEHKH